jgi:hypothetical protein
VDEGEKGQGAPNSSAALLMGLSDTADGSGHKTQ